MTDNTRALLEQALEKLLECWPKSDPCINGIRAELAKPEQEETFIPNWANYRQGVADGKAGSPKWHDAPETIALQLELASAKEAYLNACKLVADMHAAAVGEVTGPRLGVVEDVAAIKTERDAAMKDAERYRYLRGQQHWSEALEKAIDAAIAKAEGREE